MKTKYKIRNWPAYNRSPVKRGSLTVWLEGATEDRRFAPPSGKPGGRRRYADEAIETLLLIRAVFRLSLRSLEGFASSLLARQDAPLPVPDYTTFSRRAKTLSVRLKKRPKEITDIVIDSTGVKVYGEGEWKVRSHGASKRRTWKKLHAAIDEDGELRATEVADPDTHDADAAKPLLDQEDAKIRDVCADGAYDRRKVYDACGERGIGSILIPPRKDAKIWIHGNAKNAPRHPRDENLRKIRRIGRTAWKESSGYRLRSLVENTMFRIKTIFGDKLRSRLHETQVTELKLVAQALNRMWRLGMPESYPVTA
jgi:hypothetical protein